MAGTDEDEVDAAATGRRQRARAAAIKDGWSRVGEVSLGTLGHRMDMPPTFATETSVKLQITAYSRDDPLVQTINRIFKKKKNTTK